MTGSEMPRPVPADRIRAGQRETVDARPEECAAIARRLNIPSLESLRCTWTLRPERAGAIAAEGELEAALHQECVVSLEPFPTTVHESFVVRFVPAGTEDEAADEPDAPDELPYGGPSIDLGEAALEQLALALDPYPRRPGAELPDAPDESAAGPFAGLAGRLRRE